MERQKFDDSWKNAFEQAEVSPSDNLWTNIELDLERSEGGKMKSRLLFYKMLAAASVIFAMSVFAIGAYLVADQRESTQQIASGGKPRVTEHDQVETTPLSQPEDNSFEKTERGIESKINDRETNLIASDSESEILDKGSKNQTGEQISDVSNVSRNEGVHNEALINSSRTSTLKNKTTSISTSSVTGRDAIAMSSAEDARSLERAKASERLSQGYLKGRALPPLAAQKNIQLKLLPKNEEVVDPVIAMLARLEKREEEVRTSKEDKRKENDEKIWTSLGFAAGSFNTVNPNISAVAQNTSGPAANGFSFSTAAKEESKASGVSYSVGMNLGARVASRWVVQGGVNYLTQVSEYESESVIRDAATHTLRPSSINELNKLVVEGDATGDKEVPVVRHTVNNSLRYISVPVQAGYLLIDRNFGLQLNAGLSTDLFIQSTTKAEGAQNVDKTSQGRGEDSPYRSVNFSGLFGTELSYKFGTRYRVSLNPGLRYSMNTIYKSDLGVETNPLAFDVGLRFRYILK
ncbi:MAG: outer membrane beta-barrel protein [Bacteroidota bacterium]